MEISIYDLPPLSPYVSVLHLNRPMKKSFLKYCQQALAKSIFILYGVFQ